MPGIRRTRPFIAAALAALVLTSAPPARADEAAAPLTLDEALKLARAQSRDLKAARAHLEQSHPGIESAYVALLPTLSGQGKFTHNNKEVTVPFGSPPPIIQAGDQGDFSLNAAVPLVVPSAYPALKGARQSYSAAEADFQVTEATLLTQAAQAFYAAAGADELLHARQNAVTVAQKTRATAQARLDNGTVNRVEVTRAEVAVVRAEQAEREADDTRAQTYAALATILQLRTPFHVVPPAEPLAFDDGGDPVKLALTLRPEFASSHRSLDALGSRVRSQKWLWAPTLSAFGNARAFTYKGFSGDNYAWAAGAQLDWLLFDGGARYAQRHLLEAQRREAELRLAQLRDTVADDVRTAERAVKTKRQAVASAQRALDLSRDSLELTRAQYQNGTALQIDLLTAQDSLVASEVALAQARFDLGLATVQLGRATGAFPGALSQR